MKMNTLRLGAALLVVGFASSAGGAQEIRHVYSGSQLRETPDVALARHLRTLAESPRNGNALKGAGEAALALNDPQTALTFFARAEEVTPRDGRVKAGMGSAFVLLEQPEAALRFFAEAKSMGILERTFAGDRGLAYDLTGDPIRAQADYRMSLAYREDPDVRQRLALSLAISGDRDGAIKTIDDLLRKQDRGAWRTRAFILALTGDTAGATEATRAVLPAQASALQPFFARLPWLTPAERAMAVHFGRIPTAGTQNAAAAPPAQTQYANAGPATGQATSPSRPTASSRRAAQAEPDKTSARRRPGSRDGTVRQAPFAKAQRTAEPASAPPTQRSGRTAVRTAPLPSSEKESEPSDPAPAPAADAKPAPTGSASAAGASQKSAPERTKPAKTAAATPPAKKPPVVRLPFGPPTPGTPPRLADIGEAVAAVPDAAQGEQRAPAPKAAAPSRHWVQIAGGANKDGLPREFKRLKAKAPDLLSGKTAWTSPLRFTNRLLVGPFESETEAQAFVNALVAADLAAFSWTSAEGQEIEKLAVQ
ncbi:SPOR domain-containing protein [Sphingosinicella humi]|nr:SPOR domain-containing protein [Sphingosinicella humi]